MTFIVGYTWQAELFCPACLRRKFLGALPTSQSMGKWETDVEELLNEFATERGVDRSDEHSFDGDDFPKVVTIQQVDLDQCGVCWKYLDDGTLTCCPGCGLPECDDHSEYESNILQAHEGGDHGGCDFRAGCRPVTWTNPKATTHEGATQRPRLPRRGNAHRRHS